MNCPKCDAGSIRVMTFVACSCGHHKVVCDGCFRAFAVPCGPPYGPRALPPEIVMSEDDSLAKAHAKLRRDIEEADGKPAPGPETFVELMREEIARAPDMYPLLEDFKASLDAAD